MTTAVTRYFFTALYRPPSAGSVIKWWESRRLLFNACVGGAGLLTLGVGTLLMGPGVPWGAVLFFGVLANLGYSFGSVVDLFLRRALGERADPIGPVLFRYGFVFSIGLTLLPIPLMLLGWILRLIFV